MDGQKAQLYDGTLDDAIRSPEGYNSGQVFWSRMKFLNSSEFPLLRGKAVILDNDEVTDLDFASGFEPLGSLLKSC